MIEPKSRRQYSLTERSRRSIVAFMLKRANRLCQTNRQRVAYLVLRGLIEIAPRILIVRLCFASVALGLGHEEECCEAIREESIRDLPAIGYHARRVAAIQLRLDNVRMATQYLRKSLDVFPNSLRSRIRLAGALFRGDHNEVMEAVSLIHEVIGMETASQRRLQLLSQLTSEVSGIDKEYIETIYKLVIDVAPERASGALCEVIESRRVSDISDPLSIQAKEFLCSTEIEIEDRRHLHFALGGIYDRSGDATSAIAHYSVANHLSLQTGFGKEFKLDEAIRQATSRRNVFTTNFMQSRAPHGCADPILICIFGMPRSGTTLLHEILCECEGVYAGGERTDFHQLATLMPSLIGSKTPYPECVLELSNAQITKFAERLLKRFRRLIGDHRRLVTKMPDDYLEIGLIKLLFPNTRFIHCRRDPVDTCFSCYAGDFGSIPYSNDLRSLEAVYRRYQLVTGHWQELLNGSELFEVQYEQFVASPDESARSLCQFCDLEFKDNCDQFYRSQRPVGTLSRWQVRQPIYSTSVNRADRFREFIAPLYRLRDPLQCDPHESSQESSREPNHLILRP